MAADPIISPSLTELEAARGHTGVLEPGSTGAESLVTRLSERLAASANARQVYGEPITAHNRTIVPVAKAGYGVGAGSGARGADASGGGGGGGGVGVRPTGFIEITEEGTRFVPFSTSRNLIAALAAGLLGGYLIGRLRS